jgi:hypothetical protein
MKSVRPLLIVPALAILLAAVPTLAEENHGFSLKNGGVERSSEQTAAQFQPGNYCLSCHTPGDDRPATVMAWRGSMAREVISPCPAASRVHEEVYYTERLLLAIGRARAGTPGDLSKTDARIAAARQTYSRLLDTPVNSLDALSSEAKVLRFRLGKSYREINQLREVASQDLVLYFAGVVTLVLLISLGWGLRNSARFSARGGGRFHLSFKAVLFIVLVLVLFSLPIFRVFSQVTASSAEEQARQAVLDTATRVAGTADRELARSWMLARVGAAWPGSDARQADAALAAAKEAQLNAITLWGNVQAAQEATVGLQFEQEKAGMIGDQLNAAESRAWGLRLIAAEWAPVNPARAENVLEEALAVANSNTGIYRELDVRAIAVTWATINPDKGLAVADRVYDPALRAWALWEIAGITGDKSLYGRAAEAARRVSDPVDRARSLREIAVRSGDKALFAEALAALDGVEGVPLAYALGDLAAASGDSSIAARIGPAYPDARAAALYRLGLFEEAWAAAAKIEDPFDQAHAQAAIAGKWGNADAARQIADPTLRDLALRDVAVAGKDVTLAKSIESPYYRVQALTALGQYQAAAAEAGNLSDTYPLRALAVAWAGEEPQSALALVDKMEREDDKAEALRAIAAATGDQAIFERALGMALAARVSGDALAPAQASLALAETFKLTDKARAEAAFAQAYDAAQRISIIYK